MKDKKVIITEDMLEQKPKIDLYAKDEKSLYNKQNINNNAYEMYQKFQNISLERDHVLTLRRGK